MNVRMYTYYLFIQFMCDVHLFQHLQPLTSDRAAWHGPGDPSGNTCGARAQHLTAIVATRQSSHCSGEVTD